MNTSQSQSLVAGEQKERQRRRSSRMACLEALGLRGLGLRVVSFKHPAQYGTSRGQYERNISFKPLVHVAA